MVEGWRCLALVACAAFTSGDIKAMEIEPATTIIPKLPRSAPSLPLASPSQPSAEPAIPLRPSYAAEEADEAAPSPATSHALPPVPAPAAASMTGTWATTLSRPQPAEPKRQPAPSLASGAPNAAVPLPSRGGAFLAASTSASAISPPAFAPPAPGDTPPSVASGLAGQVAPVPAPGKIAVATAVATPPALLHREIGMASFYHGGGRTASGTIAGGMTAAHRKLPFGTRVRVRDMKTGKEVVVTITDRGPFKRSRVIDLSHMAARELGITGRGIARVEVVSAN
jgi:rare lipoprotein A